MRWLIRCDGWSNEMMVDEMVDIKIFLSSHHLPSSSSSHIVDCVSPITISHLLSHTSGLSYRLGEK